VKLHEHSSLGLDDASIVSGQAAVEAVLRARREELGGEWFAEAFVPGRELNVALLAAGGAPRALPVAEIRFQDFPAGKPHIVGYAAKWDTSSFEYRNTVRSFAVETGLSERARDLALECWDVFAPGGYARVDFRVDERGEPWVLEINANPCLSPDAGFAAAAGQAGIDFDTLIAALMRTRCAARGAAMMTRASSSEPKRVRPICRRCASSWPRPRCSIPRNARLRSSSRSVSGSQRSGYEFIFAELDGESSATAPGARCRSPCSYDLYWIVVAPRRQGLGIGRRPLALAEGAVARRGGGGLYIETSSRGVYLRTRRFYRSSELRAGRAVSRISTPRRRQDRFL
jgi:GNAT superfamily N-acetyltransferase